MIPGARGFSLRLKRGYQDQLNSSSLLSLRAKRSNPRQGAFQKRGSRSKEQQWQGINEEGMSWVLSLRNVATQKWQRLEASATFRAFQHSLSC